jgi:hypothetical protein
MSADKPFIADNFSIEPSRSAVALLLTWRGELTLQDPGAQIGPFLDGCLQGAGGRRVILDFTAMGFMNSSSLVPIIACVKRAAEMNLSCELRYNKAVGWQRVSYNSMTVLCKRTPKVTVTYGEPSDAATTPRADS